jgi:serine/threonine-protein kinase RsbT
MGDEIVLEINDEVHVVLARTEAVRQARRLGFSQPDAAVIATAVMEVANNILRHAGRGTVTLRPLWQDGRQGISVVAHDSGPGIADIARAMEDGYSTDGGLGRGLAALRRMMDEFEIDSTPAGTTVTLKKFIWVGNGRY